MKPQPEGKAILSCECNKSDFEKMRGWQWAQWKERTGDHKDTRMGVAEMTKEKKIPKEKGQVIPEDAGLASNGEEELLPRFKGKDQGSERIIRG